MKRRPKLNIVAAQVEILESRQLLSAAAVPVAIHSIDGTGNNQEHPDWGSTGEQLLRKSTPAYTDGISSPSGATLPSPREISNLIANQEAETDIVDERGMSAMVYAWGQFIDHDLDLTPTGNEKLTIPVPADDPNFASDLTTNRSIFDPATGTTDPRQQINKITSWLDGSMIYGSDQATADSLRTFQDGKLKTSDGNLLPKDSNGLFLAGDVRANENIELTSLQTLFVREHNFWADKFKNSGLTDEQIYQKARTYVIAELQSITYDQWLPALLGGSNPVGRYKGYNPNVNPDVATEFSTAGFRLGHSLLGNDVQFLDNNGQDVADEVPLSGAFFNPSLVTSESVPEILKYLASDPSSRLDNKIVDGVRNFLITSPGAVFNLDLASLNIERGRDHGLPDYNTVREAYGLPKVTKFSQITSNKEVQNQLETLYGDVNHIDVWVGALAENHTHGSVGDLVNAIVVDQFRRLRDGDRFWYESNFKGAELQRIKNTSLADIISRNTTTTNLQGDVFFFRASISGRVLGTSGKTAIELVSKDTGEVLYTTQTDRRGFYKFDVQTGLRTGEYYVQVAGRKRTARPVEITKGDTFAVVNLNLRKYEATDYVFNNKMDNLFEHFSDHRHHLFD